MRMCIGLNEIHKSLFALNENKQICKSGSDQSFMKQYHHKNKIKYN